VRRGRVPQSRCDLIEEVEAFEVIDPNPSDSRFSIPAMCSRIWHPSNSRVEVMQVAHQEVKPSRKRAVETVCPELNIRPPREELVVQQLESRFVNPRVKLEDLQRLVGDQPWSSPA